MSKQKKIIFLFLSLPLVYGIFSFSLRTLGIFEPYLSPIPLQILPIVPKVSSTYCGDYETVTFIREYDVNMPFKTVKEYYRKQMDFYCSNNEEIYLACDKRNCFSASCDLRFPFAFMDFNYANPQSRATFYFLELLPLSKGVTRVTQRQFVDTFIPDGFLICVP